MTRFATPRSAADAGIAGGPLSGSRSAQGAARRAHAAADQLLDWLRQGRGASRDAGRGAPAATELATHDDAATSTAGEATKAAAEVGASPALDSEQEPECRAHPAAAGEDPTAAGAPLRLAHTDWLHHRLLVSGPTGAVAEFQAAACGAGTVPWQLDPERMEEDLLHMLAAPPAPQRRTLNIAGARALAGQLREAAALRHAAAAARVGRSRACALDLHALVPVPDDVLRLGPDHPDALAWLWRHWGTTAALRHVAAEPAPALRRPAPADVATVRLTFWSADWTPWRALATVATRWPALRFDVRPTYGAL